MSVCYKEGIHRALHVSKPTFVEEGLYLGLPFVLLEEGEAVGHVYWAVCWDVAADF